MRVFLRVSPRHSAEDAYNYTSVLLRRHEAPVSSYFDAEQSVAVFSFRLVPLSV